LRTYAEHLLLRLLLGAVNPPVLGVGLLVMSSLLQRWFLLTFLLALILGSATNNPVFAWECTDCASSGEYTPNYPGIVIEDTVDRQGDYWERSLHPSEARFKKAFGKWVPEGYETELEELHRTVATNALERKFNAS